METFETWLNGQLEKYGMTANSLSKEVKLSSQTVKSYTRGENPRPELKKKIVDYFETKATQEPQFKTSTSQTGDYYNPVMFEELKDKYERLVESKEKQINLLEGQLKWLQESFSVKLTPNFLKPVSQSRRGRVIPLEPSLQKRTV